MGIDKLSPAEQVRHLLDTPATDLSSKLAGVPLPLQAVVDNDVVKQTPTYALLAAAADSLETLFPGAKWCKTVAAGDCAVDGMIMFATALASRTDNLHAALRRNLEAALGAGEKLDAVLKGYGIDEAKSEDRMPVANFITDIMFAGPARATAAAWADASSRLGTTGYLTHFNLPNPWDGPWKGHATHALDTAFLLGNYNEFLSAGQRAAAERMALDVLSSAYGKAPLPAYSGAKDGKSTVYYAAADGKEDESYVATETDESKSGRRNVLQDVAAGDAEVMDKILGAFGKFLQGA